MNGDNAYVSNAFLSDEVKIVRFGRSAIFPELNDFSVRLLQFETQKVEVRVALGRQFIIYGALYKNSVQGIEHLRIYKFIHFFFRMVDISQNIREKFCDSSTWYYRNIINSNKI